MVRRSPGEGREEKSSNSPQSSRDMKPKPRAKTRPVKMPQGFTMDSVRELCRLARKGNPIALTLAWHGATQLAKTVLAAAEREPKQLERLARSSLYMPSVLSSSTAFNNATAKVVKHLKLSADCATGHRPKSRLDSLMTRFVVENYEVFEQTRREIQHFASAYQKSRKAKKKFRTLERHLVENLAFASEDLRFLNLGPLSNETVEKWWKEIFKPLCEDELTMDEIRGTPLYKQISDATEKTDYDIRNELKRRCQDALERLAAQNPPSENT